MPAQRVSKQFLARSFVWVILAYIVALGAATAALSGMGPYHSIIKVCAADLAATLAIFAFGRIFHNASFYDPYWSLAPIFIALYSLLIVNNFGEISWNQVLVLGLVIIWGLRLTFNWASRWQGQNHEDWRYTQYRSKFGRAFWLIELLGIELVPTILVFLGCLSLYLVLTADRPVFAALQWVATAVTLAAIIIETTSDAQLKHFQDSGTAPGGIMQKGLWNYSRHPNYLR